MIRKEHIVVSVLIVVSASLIWAFPLAPKRSDIISEINWERYMRGLREVEEVGALSAFAAEYSRLMARRNEMSHDLMSNQDKHDRIMRMSPSYSPLRRYEGELQYWENVARIPAPWEFRYTPHGVAHVFDNSPSHARTIYHKDIEWIGVGIANDAGGTWWVTIIVVRRTK